ncbi:MAG: rod shape-determining protein MreC [Gammaproteobacteria bacterium]
MAPSAADSEARSYRNASPGLAFFLTTTLSLVLMFVDHRGDYLSRIRTGLATAIHPLQLAINSPAAGLRWMQENLALRSTLIADNAALRKQALVQAAQLQRMAALQAENQRFRALLDSRSRIPDRMTVGEILAVDMDPLRHRVILDKGSPQGAHAGQVLLDANGVVGQIMRDQIYSSEAILITDPDHALPVEVVRNGMRTIAVGTGNLDRLSLPFLTRNADVKAGDLLVTSGLGGRFPAGYPVGTITAVDGSEGDAFLEVTAKPAASLDRLHEVLLVFSPETDAPAEEQPEEEPAP